MGDNVCPSAGAFTASVVGNGDGINDRGGNLLVG